MRGCTLPVICVGVVSISPILCPIVVPGQPARHVCDCVRLCATVCDCVRLCAGSAVQIDLPFARTIELLEQQAWMEIMEHDQLTRERTAGRVFYGFNEAPCLFPPTYRWVREKAVVSNKREQSPSYTDRLMYLYVSPTITSLPSPPCLVLADTVVESRAVADAAGTTTITVTTCICLPGWYWWCSRVCVCVLDAAGLRKACVAVWFKLTMEQTPPCSGQTTGLWWLRTT